MISNCFESASISGDKYFINAFFVKNNVYFEINFTKNHKKLLNLKINFNVDVTKSKFNHLINIKYKLFQIIKQRK